MFRAIRLAGLDSTTTSEVSAEVQTWQQRPLESTYAAVALGALRVKVRDEGVVQNKAVYLALDVRLDGKKEVSGFWIAQTEGAALCSWSATSSCAVATS